MSTTPTTTSIRAWYTTPTGRLCKAYKSHINDNGFPLCRCRARDGFTGGSPDKWVVSFEEPTCPVCLRMAARSKGGVA